MAINHRAPVDVAVGVLLRPDDDNRHERNDAFLMTTRPPGKVYEGHWEFPGGKIEAGESVEQALRRELWEELGITIGAAVPWKTQQIDYPHGCVNLHFCKVYDWTGELTMREGQQMMWLRLPVDIQPLLPGSLPVLDWLSKER